MKRFYREVAVHSDAEGHFITLDGRAIKTQGGRPQRVPARALAEAMAAEWEMQGEVIDPAHFVYRDMADYAIDVVPEERAAIIAKLLRYGETDTLCYRADPDEPLWHRQRTVWDPLVEAYEVREGVKLERVSGVVARPHPRATGERLEARLTTLDDFTLAAAEQATALAASLCIGLSALEPEADGEMLWDAANLEEDWQVEQWGEDEEASARRARRLESFLKSIAFARLARG